MLISCVTYSQCADSIKVSNDSCRMVTMPFFVFTDFYKAKENYKVLSEQVPEVKHSVDSLRKINRRLQVNYLNEIDSLNTSKILLNETVKDCRDEFVNLQLNNLYLEAKVKKAKERKKWIFTTGALTGILLILLVQ